MGAEDELVALYDADGHETGVAPRGAVYRDRLWHAATGVLVRSGDGLRMAVHRRTETKLVFPGAWDCWAGGVLGPGETPEDGARRELAEELGITGTELTALPPYRYEGVVRYHVFTYETRWDGPLTPQPEEVAWAGWWTVAELRERLADPARWPFADDGRVGIERWLSGAV